jgi:general stress protein CsbA
MWAIGAAGLTTFLWCPRVRPRAFFVVSLLLASIFAVCPGFYFRKNYFILLLPAVSLLAGVGVSCATEKLLAWHRHRALSAIPVLAFLIAFSYTIFQQREFFFQWDPITACRRLYSGNPFTGAIDIGNFIKTHTSPDARIAVVGSEPEIYFYSHRHSATGYIYTYPLMEKQKYAATMQNEMIAEIENARPEYVIYVDTPGSWLPQPGADWYIFAWVRGYLHNNYTIIGVDLVPLGYPLYYLPEATSIDRPLSTLNVYVFRRKEPTP